MSFSIVKHHSKYMHIFQFFYSSYFANGIQVLHHSAKIITLLNLVFFADDLFKVYEICSKPYSIIKGLDQQAKQDGANCKFGSSLGIQKTL